MFSLLSMVHNAYGAAAVRSANTLDEEVKSIMGNSSKLRGNHFLLALVFWVVGPHPNVARMMRWECCGDRCFIQGGDRHFMLRYFSVESLNWLICGERPARSGILAASPPCVLAVQEQLCETNTWKRLSLRPEI